MDPSANPAADGIVLVEDPAVEKLGPVVLLRPAPELVVGAFTLRERVERVSGLPVVGACLRSRLRGLGLFGGCEERSHGPRLCVSAACLLEREGWAEICSLAPGRILVSDDGRFIAGQLDVNESQSVATSGGSAFLASAAGMLVVAKAARLLRHWPDLVSAHERLLGADVSEAIGETDLSPVLPSVERGTFVHGTGVFAAEGVSIEGPVAIDATAGPVLLRKGVSLAPFSRLEGPLLIGEGTRVLGGRVAQSYLGPGCLARGEIASSVLLGWSNKAHEGFLGHSYLGEWVNLGALTTTSNLKNTYGEILVRLGERFEPSGRVKLGSMIGDHTKTAIGSLLATGSTIGVGVSFHGAAGLGPRFVPSFTWGTGPRANEHELARFLVTAERALARRGRTLDASQREAITRAFEATAGERHRFLDGERA